MDSWSLFIDSWDLFADSALAGALAGAALGAIGVYIVLKRMIFLSAALSQVAGFGVVLAFFSGVVSPSVGAAVATFAAAGVLMSDRSADGDRRERLLGITFLVGACGTLILSGHVVQELQDVQSLLFGSAVAVVPADFTQLAIVCCAVLALHLWWMRGFAAVVTDPIDASVRRLPVRTLELMLLVTIAITISTVTRVLGALPAFAFSVLPAVAALRVAPSIPLALMIACGLGAASGFGGYFMAFAWELPVGAAQTLVGIGFLTIVSLLRLVPLRAWR